MHAGQILVVVGDLVAQFVSPGQIQDLHGQLPDGLRDIFTNCSDETANVE